MPSKTAYLRFPAESDVGYLLESDSDYIDSIEHYQGTLLGGQFFWFENSRILFLDIAETVEEQLDREEPIPYVSSKQIKAIRAAVIELGDKLSDSQALTDRHRQRLNVLLQPLDMRLNWLGSCASLKRSKSWPGTAVRMEYWLHVEESEYDGEEEDPHSYQEPNYERFIPKDRFDDFSKFLKWSNRADWSR